jgi:hypothetical protein
MRRHNTLRECQVRTQAETGVMSLQAEDWGQPSEAGKNSMHSLRSVAWQHLNFRLSAPRTVREYISVI